MSGQDQGFGAPEALKGSPEGAFTFRPTDVQAYHIIFHQDVQVDTFQFQIKQSTSVSQKLYYLSNPKVLPRHLHYEL